MKQGAPGRNRTYGLRFRKRLRSIRSGSLTFVNIRSEMVFCGCGFIAVRSRSVQFGTKRYQGVTSKTTQRPARSTSESSSNALHANNPAGARTAYAELAASLKTIGAVPSAETEALYTQLVRRNVA